MHQLRLISLSLVFMFGFTASATSADQTLPNQSWSQWRGPQRDGTLPGTALPDSLSEQNLQLRWQLPLSPGYSGPIVTADRVFVTETVNEETEVVRRVQFGLLRRVEFGPLRHLLRHATRSLQLDAKASHASDS